MRFTIYSILFLFLSICYSCTEQKKQPNIVFFLVDDLGWRDVGCYGSSFYETPNVDRLAEEGIRFTSAYAACHVCSPTRASIMTGKYPARINLTDWLTGRRDFPFQKLLNVKITQHLPYDIPTIPKVLKEHGYQTAIFGKWHLGEDSASTTRQGFDTQLPDWNRGWPKNGYYFPYDMKGLEKGCPGEYLTDRMSKEAIKYIEQNKDRPFFLYLAHFAVHDPIEGRPDLVDKYRRKLATMHSPEGDPFILEGRPGISVKIKQHQDNVQFAAMVESMDESLGRVLGKLEELDLEDNTIVIFYSDNGGMSAANFWDPNRKIPEEELDQAFSTSNLPLRGAKGWMYEGGIRVPLIIKWPGKGLHKTTCDVPVTSPDFFPTILDMLGINSQEIESDGVSIVPLLTGRKDLDREAIYWHFPHYSNHGMQSPGGAIREGDYKLLDYFENGSVQLFNLRTDIGEQNDLSAIEIEKTMELKAKLDKWRIDVNAQMMKPNPNYNTASEVSKYLLLDNRIIEEAANVKLEVGTVVKHPDNPLFEEEEEWEMRFDNLYGNVIFDEEEQIYKCWYSPFIVDSSSRGMTIEERSRRYDPPENREMGICYATSVDGISWEKPELGLVAYNGSMQNNIVWRGPHGAGVMKDLQEEDPAKRYKVIFQGMYVSFSADGIHWDENTPVNGVDVAGDTHNNALWAPTLNKFVGITRTWGQDFGREVARIESEDFTNWTKEEVVMHGTAKDLQTYAMPVFFYEGVYLGLVAIHQQSTDRVWTELTWSPDTKTWHRIDAGNPLIPCSDKELDYDYGCVYPCAYPVFKDDEIKLYYGGSDWLHFGWRNGSLALATLRQDGFAGYVSLDKSSIGSITTRSIPYKGECISLTADVEEGGSVRISVVNDKGETLGTATVKNTVSDEGLQFDNKIRKGNIKLKFDISHAKVYAFSL